MSDLEDIVDCGRKMFNGVLERKVATSVEKSIFHGSKYTSYYKPTMFNTYSRRNDSTFLNTYKVKPTAKGVHPHWYCTVYVTQW